MYGKFAIMGSHEFYADIEHAMAFTRKAGIGVLRCEGITVNGLINISVHSQGCHTFKKGSNNLLLCHDSCLDSLRHEQTLKISDR
ncbi:MAG: hypothetical protein M1381_01650 [Deltaproteobacteria bacterium]|nr:hypothetical protein [Deltaproteobacteria bacterium]